MREAEACHLQMLAIRDKTCPAHYKCTNSLQSIHKNEWIFAKNAWIVL